MDIFWNYTLYSIYIIQKYQQTFFIDDHYKFQGICYSNVKLQWNFDIMKGLAKYMYVCYNKVLLYEGSFQYSLLLLGPQKSFVILRTSSCRGLLNQGSTGTNHIPSNGQ